MHKAPDIKFLFLVGLPGSGKTTFGKKYVQEHRNSVLMSLDSYRDVFMKKDPSQLNLLDKALRYISFYAKNTYIIDGLFLTNESISEALSYVIDEVRNAKFEIHYWNENRDYCIMNDGGRRSESSVYTIKNSPFDALDIDYIKNAIGDRITDVIYHDVVLKDDWELYFNGIVNVEDDGKLRSDRWCTGGYFGTCWDDEKHPVYSEKPVYFTEFDELLECICPTLSFTQYNKIKESCVSTEYEDEGDYYGGNVEYCRWVCDLKSLYQMLKEMGYIDNK